MAKKNPNGHVQQDRTPAKRANALRMLCLMKAANLPSPDKGRLAAELLEDAPLGREVFDAFWAGLDEGSQEELASWISLKLDGDEHEAALTA